MIVLANRSHLPNGKVDDWSVFLSVLFRWVIVVLSKFFDGMKLTTYDANGIALFIARSPIIRWVRALFGGQADHVRHGCPGRVDRGVIDARGLATTRLPGRSADGFNPACHTHLFLEGTAFD